MKILSVINEKGGSGKSTVATNLATALHRAGHRVVLVDADPQGTARMGAQITEFQEAGRERLAASRKATEEARQEAKKTAQEAAEIKGELAATKAALAGTTK